MPQARMGSHSTHDRHTALPVRLQPRLADNTKAAVNELRSIALETNAIANAARYAIEQPADVDVNEMIIRTVRSAGHAF